jgi:hypothetical protein
MSTNVIGSSELKFEYSVRSIEPNTKTKKKYSESSIPILLLIADAKIRKIQNNGLTEYTKQLKSERSKELVFERKILEEETKQIVKEFNRSIEELSYERSQLIADLKFGEIKLICLYQEYLILLTFEDRDISIQQKQKHFIIEKNDLEQTILQNKEKVELKNFELDKCNEKLIQLGIEVPKNFPDLYPYCEILTKIYKKKIKRKRSGDNDGDDEGDDNDDDDDDDNFDDDEEEVEDVCPVGCDSNIYNKVLQLRERRLDIEEEMLEINKQVEDYNKIIERLKQRGKQLMKDSTQADLEMELFQKQKQTALNEVQTAIPVKLSQIYAFEASGVFTVPSDQSVVSEDNPVYSTYIQNIEKLEKVDDRCLIDEIDMQSHVLFDIRCRFFIHVELPLFIFFCVV